MKEHDPRKIEELMTDILVGTTFMQFLYAGVFIMNFEPPGADQNIVRLQVFSNITLTKGATIPDDDPVQEYLESCRVLHKAFGQMVKQVNILPNNSLAIRFDDVELFVNSLHVLQYAILDRSWVISAKRGHEFIEILCDGMEELVANIDTSPIV